MILTVRRWLVALILAAAGCALLAPPALAGGPAEKPAEPSSGGPRWFDLYRQAIVHAELEEWGGVEKKIQESLQLNPRPQRNVRIYGMWHASYIPYFYLGLAKYRQGLYPEALSNFQKEEAAGVVQHDPVAYLKMDKIMAAIRSGKKTSGPPAPAASHTQDSPPPGAAGTGGSDSDSLIQGLQSFFQSEYDRSIAAFQEALKGGRADDLTLHLYLGMAYTGKASADPDHRAIWENLAFLEFQRVHQMDPEYRLASGIFSEEMMGLFTRSGDQP
jgi:tetratricopeptide (TPR) repeat protein